MQSNDSFSHQHKSNFSIHEGGFGRGKILFYHITGVDVYIETNVNKQAICSSLLYDCVYATVILY